MINTIDLAIQWHHRSALVYGAFLAVGTRAAYACALRLRLIADGAGTEVQLIAQQLDERAELAHADGAAPGSQRSAGPGALATISFRRHRATL